MSDQVKAPVIEVDLAVNAEEKHVIKYILQEADPNTDKLNYGYLFEETLLFFFKCTVACIMVALFVSRFHMSAQTDVEKKSGDLQIKAEVDSWYDFTWGTVNEAVMEQKSEKPDRSH